MYSDTRPCEVCGAEVRLGQHRTDSYQEADDTVDERICTNDDCPTHRADESSEHLRP